MNKILFINLLFLIPTSLLFFNRWVAFADNEVVELDKNNFNEFINSNAFVLVEFYAPWCGHCKKLAPEYDAAAKKLAEQGSTVILAKIDAVANSELSEKHGVQGYPTLYVFRDGQREDYEGGRTTDSIVNWILANSGSAVHTFTSDSELVPTKDRPVTFVGYFTSNTSDSYTIFSKVVSNLRSSGYAYVKTDAAEDKIVVHRFEEDHFTFNDTVTETKLHEFLFDESFPYLGPITAENFKRYAEKKLDAMVWYCAKIGDFENHKVAIREVAKKYRNKFSVVWMDIDVFAGHAEYAMGVTKFPAFVYQGSSGRYIMEDASYKLSDAKKIQEFIESVLNGELTPFFKSDPIPTSNDDPVKVIVGKTIETLVNSDKNHFLEIYAPWCGHCKQFEPIYVEFAEKYESVRSLVVNKMDGTTNESPNPEFQWHGFPTIYFIPAGASSPMKYEGERTVAALTQFYMKHGKNPVDLSAKQPEGSDEL